MPKKAIAREAKAAADAAHAAPYQEALQLIGKADEAVEDGTTVAALLEASLPHLEAARAAKPTHLDTLYNLGTVLLRLADAADASAAPQPDARLHSAAECFEAVGCHDTSRRAAVRVLAQHNLLRVRLAQADRAQARGDAAAAEAALGAACALVDGGDGVAEQQRDQGARAERRDAPLALC